MLLEKLKGLASNYFASHAGIKLGLMRPVIRGRGLELSLGQRWLAPILATIGQSVGLSKVAIITEPTGMLSLGFHRFKSFGITLVRDLKGILLIELIRSVITRLVMSGGQLSRSKCRTGFLVVTG